jgi:hypothetical protein
MSDNLDAVQDWPDNQSLELDWKNRGMSGQSFKNCYRGFNSFWQVKIYLGREQRVLGHGRNGIRATRFADMAILHFNKYRHRNRPLVDSDFNFSLRQAKLDLEQLPQVRALLERWETFLLAKQLIAPVTRLFDDSSNDPEQLRKQFAVEYLRLSATKERIIALLSARKEYSVTLKMISEHYDQTEKFNQSLDNLLKQVQVAPDEQTKL